VKAVWQGRIVQASSKYGEHAPMAAVCCNACRTCATTNIAGLALAAVGGAGVAIWTRITSVTRRS
jgi:Na+/alanine symporter